MWFSKIIRTKINRQLEGNKRIGGFVDVLANTMFWMSLVNFTFNSITTYTVTRAYTTEALPWLNIWIFFSVLFLGISTVMFIEYKIIIPSRQSFRNQQEYRHDSPIKKDLDEIKVTQEKSRRDIEAIKEKLGKEAKMTEDIKYTDFDFSLAIVECYTCGGFLKGSLAKEVDLILNNREEFSEKVWLCPGCKKCIDNGEVIYNPNSTLIPGPSI